MSKHFSVDFENPEISNHSRSQQNFKSLIFNLKHNYKITNQQKLLKLCGNEHKYQFYLAFTFGIIAFIQTIYFMSIFIFFAFPEIKCIDLVSKLTSSCTLEDVCLSKQNIMIESDLFTIHEEFNLFCQKNNFILKTMSLVFISSGFLSSSLFLLNNFIGRRVLVIFMSILQIIFSMLMVLIPRPHFYMFCICISCSLSFSVVWLFSAFMLFVESSSKRLRYKYFFIYIGIIALGIMTAKPIYIMFQGYRQTLMFLSISLVCFSFFYILINESPRYARDNYNILEFYNLLKTILNLNFEGERIYKKIIYLKLMLFDKLDPSQISNSPYSDENKSVDSIDEQISDPISVKDDMDLLKQNTNLNLSQTLTASKQISPKFSVENNLNENDLNKFDLVKIKNKQIKFKFKSIFNYEITSQTIIAFLRIMINSCFVAWFWLMVCSGSVHQFQFNSLYLSLAMFAGTLISIIYDKLLSIEKILTFVSFFMLTIICMIISLSNLTESLFEVKYFFLYLFCLLSSTSLFINLREIIRNMPKDLKAFGSVLAIWSLFLGLAVAAKIIEYLERSDICPIWGLFTLSVFYFFVTMLSRFKPKEPFSRIQSPV